jgi:peptidoglycan/LPS O-acetylase OafA/YrhL
MKYFERLDGLRAFAVGAVMMSHYVPNEYQLGIPWGEFGVHLFFIISGFLITRILRKSMGRPMSRSLLTFYARRFLRIFPLYYFCLLWISLFGWGLDFSATALWHWTYTSNWLFWSEGQWGSVSHFWSLAVEEQFYLVWPLLFLSVMQDRKGRWMAAMLFLAGLIYRLYVQNTTVDDSAFWGIATPACLESLGMGAVLAHYWKSCSMRTISRMFLVSCLLLFVFIALVHEGHVSGEWRFQAFLLWAVMAIWFVCRSEKTAIDGFFFHPFVRYLGMISYGLYVWHNFMGIPWHAMANFMGFPEWLEFRFGAIIGKSMLTVLFATATWYGFEKPLLRLKDRFQYSSV